MSDLAELFDRDPLTLTTEQLDTIVAKLRESRAQFNSGNRTAGKVKPKTKPQKLDAEKSKSLLDDLDL